MTGLSDQCTPATYFEFHLVCCHKVCSSSCIPEFLPCDWIISNFSKQAISYLLNSYLAIGRSSLHVLVHLYLSTLCHAAGSFTLRLQPSTQGLAYLFILPPSKKWLPDSLGRSFNCACPDCNDAEVLLNQRGYSQDCLICLYYPN